MLIIQVTSITTFVRFTVSYSASKTLAFLMYKMSPKCLGSLIVQELCESRGGRPNEPSGFRGRKDTLKHASALVSACP